jgi:hypothetical protein
MRRAQILLITSYDNAYTVWDMDKGLTNTFNIERDDIIEEAGLFEIVSDNRIYEDSTGTLYDFRSDKVLFQRQFPTFLKQVISNDELLIENKYQSIVWNIDTNIETIFPNYQVKFHTRDKLFAIYNNKLYTINGEITKVNIDVTDAKIRYINDYLFAICYKNHIDIIDSVTFDKVTTLNFLILIYILIKHYF